MSKKKVKHKANNKVVAYYIEKKYDTLLDSIEIQKKRVQGWAEKAGCDIVYEVIDKGDGKGLSRAFEIAAAEGGSVLCSDITRVITKAVEYFERIEDKQNLIVFAEMEIYKVNWQEDNVYNGFIYGTKAACYENYLGHCEKWLK